MSTTIKIPPRKIVKKHEFRGQWRLELECGHFVERAKTNPIPKSNKMTCNDCRNNARHQDEDEGRES